jgi:hypothetical protein
MKKLIITLIILILAIPFILTNCPTTSPGSTGYTHLFYTLGPVGVDTISKVRLDNTSDKTDFITENTNYIRDMKIIRSLNRMFLCDLNDKKIYSVNLDNSTDIVPIYETTGTDYPANIDIDLSNSKIYWSDWNGRIRNKNLDGTGSPTTITTIENVAQGMAIDFQNNKIYWSDTVKKEIFQSNLDGSNIQMIANGLTTPTDVVIDSNNKYLYFIDLGTKNIQRINLDSTSDKTTILPSLDTPSGITLDISNGKIYWSDKGLSKISRANLDGSNIEVVLTGLDTPTSLELY